MAQINLTAGESTTVVATQTVSGTTTNGETVTILANSNITFTPDFNSGGDKIILTGSAGQFTVEKFGSSSIILRGNGITVTFPAPNPNLAANLNPVISFSNGGVAQDFVLDATPQGAFTLTSTAAGSTAQSIDPTAATVGGTPTPPVQPATVAVTASNVTEGAGSIVYTFTLSQAQTSTVTLNVNTTAAGTATAGVDFTPIAQQVTFLAGQTVAQVIIAVSDDAIVEATETVLLNVTSTNPAITVTGGPAFQAQILDNDVAPPPPPPPPPPASLQVILTTGNDIASGGAADDRFVGAQDLNLPGKLLSANDILNGGAGVDTIELTNSPANPAPNVLADADFGQVTNMESLVTNYAVVQLGARAAAAFTPGVTITVNTALRIDAANIAGNVFGGTLLDLTSDLDGNGPDFVRAINATLASSVADTVRLSLTAAAGSSIDTGTTFTPVGGAATIGVLDNIQFVGQVNPVRISFISAGAGNGNSFNADGTLAVIAQSEDAADGLVGGIVRFDDEGLNLTGNQFDVRGINAPGTPDTARGTFSQVILGTSLVDGTVATPLAGAGGSVYINAGAGADILQGGGSTDFLVGGAGNDVLIGGAGVDQFLGGADNDIIIGGDGIDGFDQTGAAGQFSGGAGNDIYVYFDTQFVANEAINEAAGEGTDYIAIASTTAIGDAAFAGRANIEGLATDLTGALGVTLGGSAAGAGIRTVVSSDDTVNVTNAYNAADITVFGSGNVNSATLAATRNFVALQGTNPFVSINPVIVNYFNPAASSAAGNSFGAGAAAYTGAVNLGAGNDILYAGFSLAGANNNILTGGAGTDRLVIGGLQGGFGGTLAAGIYNYINPVGANFTGFEELFISASAANVAVSYTISLVNANVTAGATRFIVNGAALRGTEGLTLDGSALAADRGVDGTGGASNDVLTGGLGSDILTGGAGADRLTGGAGADTLVGGADGDTYVFRLGEFLGVDTITELAGDAGNDGLEIQNAAALGDNAFALISNVEVLTTDITVGTPANDATAEVVLGSNAANAGLLIINNGNDDVNASTFTTRGLTFNTGGGLPAGNTIAGNVIATNQGGDRINIAANATFTNIAGVNYSLGGGDGDVLNAGYIFSDTRTGSPNVGAFPVTSVVAGTVLDGGAGVGDTLLIGGLAATDNTVAGFQPNNNAAYTATYDFATQAGNFRGFEKITVAAAEVGVVGGVNGNGVDFQINLGAGNVLGTQAVTVGALTFTAFEIDASDLRNGVVNQAGGVGVGPQTTTNSQDLTVNAAAVATALVVRGGQGADVVNAGTGADVLLGGVGNDTLTGNTGNDRLEGGDGDDILVGDLLTTIGTGGTDTILGGAGNDRIRITVAQFNGDNDSVDGGIGNDTLELNGQFAAETIADVGFAGTVDGTPAGAQRYNSIEEVALVGGPGAGNTAFTYQAGFFSETAGIRTITIGSAAPGSGTASGSVISATNYLNNGVTFNDRIETAGNITLIGSRNADTFNVDGGTQAASRASTVRGGLGADTFNFGAALTLADVVDGGTGVGADVLNVGVAAAGYAGQTITLQSALNPDGTASAGIYSIETLNLTSGGTAVGATANNYTVNISNTTFEAGAATLTINAPLQATELLVVGGSTAVTNFVAGTTLAAATIGGNGLVQITANHALIINSGAGGDILIGGDGDDQINGNNGNDRIDGGGGVDTINGGDGADVLQGGAGNDSITGGNGADVIVGGLGVDTIILGNDGARDIVIVGDNEAQRAPANNLVESVQGFTFDTDGTAGLNANADVINFGSGIIASGASADGVTASTSITRGFVQTGSTLGVALSNAGSLLAAIQLIEQEFNGEVGNQTGVVGFVYQGNTYIGEIRDFDANPNTGEAFGDLVRIDGVFAGLTPTNGSLLPGTGANDIGIGIFI